MTTPTVRERVTTRSLLRLVQLEGFNWAFMQDADVCVLRGAERVFLLREDAVRAAEHVGLGVDERTGLVYANPTGGLPSCSS